MECFWFWFIVCVSIETTINYEYYYMSNFQRVGCRFASQVETETRNHFEQNSIAKEKTNQNDSSSFFSANEQFLRLCKLKRTQNQRRKRERERSRMSWQEIVLRYQCNCNVVSKELILIFLFSQKIEHFLNFVRLEFVTCLFISVVVVVHKRMDVEGSGRKTKKKEIND